MTGREANPRFLLYFGAGWSSPVARQAHNLKVVGSNPTPATKFSLHINFLYERPRTVGPGRSFAPRQLRDVHLKGRILSGTASCAAPDGLRASPACKLTVGF